MKKQFVIKSAQAVKNVIKPVSKSESNSLLKFMAADSPCCQGFDVGFVGVANKSVFSL
ncbi:hypothetical protein [Spirosoma gilvum]